jgi:hypothetical protein
MEELNMHKNNPGKYIISQNYLTNDNQIISLGICTSSTPEKSVIINELTSKELIDEHSLNILEDYQSNLLYINSENQKITLVTEYFEGTPLYENSDKENTLKYIQSYLEILKEFDTLNSDVLHTYSSDTQFVIIDKVLKHNGIVILPRDGEKIHSFEDVKSRISKVILDLIVKSEWKNNSKLFDFFTIEIFEDTYDSIKKILNKYNEIYVYTKYLHTEDVDLNENIIDQFHENSSVSIEKDSKKTFIASLLIILIAITLFFIFSPTIDKIKNSNIPNASFEKEKLLDTWSFINTSRAVGDGNEIVLSEWTVYKEDNIINSFDTDNLSISFAKDGTYRISLKVKDKSGKWSKEYSEEILHVNSLSSLDNPNDEVDESLDNLKLSFEDGVFYDTEEAYEGSKSIKMEFVEQATKKIRLNNLILNQNASISMYFKAINDNRVKITVNGYSKGVKSFSVNKSLYSKGDWEKVDFSTKAKNVDSIEIVVISSDNIIYLDNILARSFK